jgi:hypothetical protein
MAAKSTEFTERLRGLIKGELKMSNNGFADRAGIGRSTLGNYFNKQNYGRVPEWDQLVKISKASGKSVEWLLTGKEAKPSGKVEHIEDYDLPVKSPATSWAMKELFEGLKREMNMLHETVKNSKKTEDKLLAMVNRQQRDLDDLYKILREAGSSGDVSRLRKISSGK